MAMTTVFMRLRTLDGWLDRPATRSESIEDWKAVTWMSAIAPSSEAGIKSLCSGGCTKSCEVAVRALNANVQL
jgi:hypothetical protein